MAKSLKDILAGKKASKKEKPDLKNMYQWNSKDGEDFIGKHEIEKHEDRVGNGDDVYKGKTKKASYNRQSDDVYESEEELDEISKNLALRYRSKSLQDTGERASRKIKGQEEPSDERKEKTRTKGRELAWNKAFNIGGKKAKVSATGKVDRVQEDEELDEKYMGFEKLEKTLAAKGAKSPGALAAWIGRKKYGKEKFQKAAASDKKLKEAVQCNHTNEGEMCEVHGEKACPSTPKDERKNKKLLLDKKSCNEASVTTPKEKTNNVFSPGARTVPYGTGETTPKSKPTPTTDKKPINEVSPPSKKIEDWVKANKERFVKEYGQKKGMRILYAKAWKMHNEENGSPATNTDYVGPGAAGWTTGRMDTGTL